MDIKKFAVEETGDIHLHDANEEPMYGDDQKPMIITVYSPGSKTYAKAQAKNTNRMVNLLKTKGKADKSPEENRAEQVEFLCACTKSFSQNIEYDGLEGDELIKAVYSDTSIGFIAEQVQKYLGEWSNFTKGSEAS